METKPNITGIILAGGQSSRMGSDKGLLFFNKKHFIQHIIDVLKPLVSEIIIVANQKEYDVFGVKRIDDIFINQGPLAGVYTGLKHSTTKKNVVLSCDIPLINTAVLKLLLNKQNQNTNIIQIESQGKTMPLIALYDKKCEAYFLKLLKQGERRLRVAVNKVGASNIVLPTAYQKHVLNINTKQQFYDINH